MAEKIIKNTSNAYGYNYASLADIVEQGHDLPKMRIKPVFTPDGSTYVGDYFEYLDSDGQWQLGSKIVSGELRGMNKQQCRGASESYARRYTTLIALQLAGKDDAEVEAKPPRSSKEQTRVVQRPATKKNPPVIDFTVLYDGLKKCNDTDSVDKFAKEVASLYPDMTQDQKTEIADIFKQRRFEINGD